MARKFDLISELYERTCFAVTDNPVNWQSFLKTAGRNFRLRFDEQLLIYAQRPDATAVLEIERWNGTFGRWVNRGAKGIAVFEDADRSRQRLIHYFDISDTHESRYSRPVPIWEMRITLSLYSGFVRSQRLLGGSMELSLSQTKANTPQSKGMSLLVSSKMIEG